jgi:ketosteroid isomerase-like protein
MTKQNNKLGSAVEAFIAATNASDVARVLALFTQDAVIDDPSTGHEFDGHAGIREYIERYFIGYHTVTRFISLELLSHDRARIRVDFTGDFGREIGLLEIAVNDVGLMNRIDANLE